MASDVERQDSALWARVDTGTDAAGLADYLARVTAVEGVQAYKRHAYAALRVGEGARVLDVGCGIGGDVRGIAQLVGRTGRVVGLDFTEAFVAEARQQSADHPTIEYRQGDAHALPFPDASSTRPVRSACSSTWPIPGQPWRRCGGGRGPAAGWSSPSRTGTRWCSTSRIT
jgi:SAM-dependent methyltransferase